MPDKNIQISQAIKADRIKSLDEDELKKMSADDLRQLLIQATEDIERLEDEKLELSRSEEDLEISRKKYYDLFESAPVGFISLSIDGEIIDTNAKACEMLSTTRQNAFNRNFENYVAKENKYIYTRLLKSIGYNETESIEIRLITEKKTELYTQVYFQKIEVGTRKYIKLTLSDITKQKQAEIELGQLRDNLSRKVFDRTEELLKTNSNLKREIELRREAEEKVREREQRVNLIANNIPGGLYLAKYSDSVEFLYLNDEIERLTGFSKDDFLSGDKSYESLFFENERHGILEQIQDGLERNGRFHVQYRIKMRNGTEKWLDEYGAEAYTAGRQQFIVGYIRDFTENHNVLEKLKESEYRHRTLINTTSQGYWQITPDLRTTHVNEALCNMLGYTREEMIGSDPRMYIHDEYAKKYQIQLDNITRTKHRNYENVYMRKDGTPIHVMINATSLKNPDGITTGSFALITDITDLKKAQEGMRESNRMLRLVIDNIPQYIFWKDKNSVYMGCNLNFARAAGVESPEDIVGKTDYDLAWDASESKGYITTDKRIMTMNKAEYHIIETQKQADGNKAWLDTNKIPLHDEDGNVVGILGTFEDITSRIENEKRIIRLIEDLKESKSKIEKDANELRKLNDRLEMSEAKLKEMNVNKDKFFSIIAHDLKSPLSSFLSLTRVFSEQYSSLDPQDLQELSQHLYESANNVFKLMNNLLEWSRVQRGTISIIPHELMLNELIEATMEIVTMQARQKDIDLDYVGEKDIVAIADHRMISTALRNLLTNAIKFTPHGGKITVKATQPDKNNIVVSITDTGVGMDEIQLQKLFRIDKQFTSLGTAGEQGTGLGLILCKEFVELNGGRINVTSKPGRGTTFSFTLPRVK